MKKLAVILAVLFGIFFMFAVISASKESPQDREERMRQLYAIELCREKQNDELSELATRRMFREACDKMARDYRTRWGRDP